MTLDINIILLLSLLLMSNPNKLECVPLHYFFITSDEDFRYVVVFGDGTHFQPNLNDSK